MKKMLGFIAFFVGVFGIVYIFREDIGRFIYKKFILEGVEISTLTPNEYYQAKDYKYVQLTDDFIIKDKQQLLNAYYTIVDNGNDEFTLMCDRDYVDCLDDVAKLSHDQSTLSNINSFVHPYNSFASIETEYDSLGKVIVKVNRVYTSEDIRRINNKIKDIVTNYVGNITDKKEIIKKIHDYIINNTKYDSDRSDKKIVNYKSDTAYGPLFQGYGLCGGYTDAMALFLDYYDIPNFRIISENHIWNAVYLDNQWYHLDLTWDDPVSKNGKDVLEYTFFLITTEELEEIEKEQHLFDKDVFQEIVSKEETTK